MASTTVAAGAIAGGPAGAAVAAGGIAIAAGQKQVRRLVYAAGENMIQRVGKRLKVELATQTERKRGGDGIILAQNDRPSKRVRANPLQPQSARSTVRDVKLKTNTYQVDDQGTQYYDQYVKPYTKRVSKFSRRATRRTSFKRPYSTRRVFQRTAPYTRRSWGTAGRGGRAARPYGAYRSTYGRSTYGTGRPSRRYSTRRTRYWYR